MSEHGGWNYRVVHYRDGNYGLHEVFYNADGTPRTMTEQPVGFTAWDFEGPQGIRESLLMAMTDARKRPVLEEAETWPDEIEPGPGDVAKTQEGE